jgi:hypothetical protein
MTEELYGYIQALGGRFNELEILVQKMDLGISPHGKQLSVSLPLSLFSLACLLFLVAFQEIVQRNVIEVRQYGFGEMVDDVDYNLDWSVIQFWSIVKRLCQATIVSLCNTERDV